MKERKEEREKAVTIYIMKKTETNRERHEEQKMKKRKGRGRRRRREGGRERCKKERERIKDNKRMERKTLSGTVWKGPNDKAKQKWRKKGSEGDSERRGINENGRRKNVLARKNRKD